MRTRHLLLRYPLLLLIITVSVGPFVWQLSTAFKDVTEDIYAFPPQLLPSDPTLRNFERVADVIPLWSYAVNSLVVGVATVLANCLGAAMAGYALARIRFAGRRLAYFVFLVALVIPGETVMISLYLMMRSVNLTDTLVAVMLPGAVSALNVLIMRNAFAALPTDIENAALIDGANTWQRFRWIALPSVKGSVAVVAIFSFMGSWDSFLWPLIVLQDTDNYTLTVGLSYLQAAFSNEQRLMAAGTIIAVAPLVLLFAALHRYFIQGAGNDVDPK